VRRASRWLDSWRSTSSRSSDLTRRCVCHASASAITVRPSAITASSVGQREGRAGAGDAGGKGSAGGRAGTVVVSSDGVTNEF
jgi:hypothetical protein